MSDTEAGAMKADGGDDPPAAAGPRDTKRTAVTWTQTVSRDGVELTKTVETAGAVTLHVETIRQEPTFVRFSDPIPEWASLGGAGLDDDPDGDHRVEADGGATGGGKPAATGGSIRGGVTVSADDPATVAYLLTTADGTDREDADTTDDSTGFLGDGPDLPAPELLEVVPVEREAEGDTPEPRSLSWVSATGSRLPLAALNTADLPLAALDAPDHPMSDDVPEVGDLLVPADIAWEAERDPTEAALVERWSGPNPVERPAVGLVSVNDGDADGVLGTLLRAADHGFAVFVAHRGRPDDELVRIADRLGATVLTSRSGSVAKLQQRLAAAARDAGHPGIVYQSAGFPRIDYDRTLAAFARAGFEVDAIPEDTGSGATAPRVLVAVPAYNAEGTIGDVVAESLEHADAVLVVDDGSTDATADRAREAGANVVVHRRNRGYGGALKTAFREAVRLGADHVVTLDADGQHDPADIPKLVAAQEAGADVVVGSRYVAGSETRVPPIRAIGLGVVNLLTNLSMGRLDPGRWLRDTQSGYRAYTREAAESLAGARDIGNGMWASTDVLYHLDGQGFGFAEVGTTIRYDVENASSEGALGHGVGLVRNIAGVLKHTRPVVLVGIPGAMSVLIGTLLGGWALQLFIQNDPSVALTLATAIFTVGGFVLLTLATLIYTINTHPFFQSNDE